MERVAQLQRRLITQMYLNDNKKEMNKKINKQKKNKILCMTHTQKTKNPKTSELRQISDPKFRAQIGKK